MKINPLVKEGMDLLVRPSARRLYGGFFLVLTWALFFTLPRGGPGSGEGWGGAPPLFIPLTLAAVIGGLVLYLIHLSFRTGGAEEAGLWFSHTDLGPLAFTAGKIGASLLSALLFGVLPLPFLILTAHLAALPLQGAPTAVLFLTGLFFSYDLLLLLLELILEGHPVIRRILLWGILLFHTLLTPRLFPRINPILPLFALKKALDEGTTVPSGDLLWGTALPLTLILLPVLYLMVRGKSRRRRKAR